MAAEDTGPGRDGETVGREDANGLQEISKGSLAQDLRAAAVDTGEKDPEPSGADIDRKTGSDQTSSRAARENPSGEGFYKSQKEIDRAFGQRLASERRRWEREHREELQQAHAGQADTDLAGETWLPQKQMYANEYARYAGLVAEANELAEDCPDFDLMEELSNNSVFERMVSSGVPVTEAYEMAGQAHLADKEQSIRRDERRRIMDEIASRTENLPPVDHSPGLSGPVLDVTRISEEELTRLSERVRKGERVVI